MYQLYIGNKNYSSWSLRPWVLMTTLGIEFQEILVPFDDGDSWAKFRDFSPTGLVPCLHDLHGEEPLVIWESLAIVEHLGETHGEVWPSDPAARAWARAATSEMHAGFSALRNECPMTVGLRITLNSVSEALKKDLGRVGELWEEGLARFGGPYLAGAAFTAVDAFYAPVVFRLQTFGNAPSTAAEAYMQTLLDLPSMQAWSAAALAETFREPSHEQELSALGDWTADLRAPSE